VPTGLLSNSWGGDGYDVYTGYDLPALFDAVVISHEVGLRKPRAWCRGVTGRGRRRPR